jgi:hypothetical protein
MFNFRTILFFLMLLTSPVQAEFWYRGTRYYDDQYHLPNRYVYIPNSNSVYYTSPLRNSSSFIGVYIFGMKLGITVENNAVRNCDCTIDCDCLN